VARFHKLQQFGFRNRKFREATIQTDYKLRENPHRGLVQTLDAGKMDGDFTVEITLVIG
jgi:hypothetical protein